MQNKVKISIIIPVYNSEKFLEKCLDSLINQTLKDIEIICINDGSKDGSKEILERYARRDNRIILINQENEGLSCARNNGLKIAKGEYLGFVDSDDWVDIDFFEKLYNAAQKTGCEIVAGDFYRHGKFLKSQKLKYKKQEIVYNPSEKFKKANIPVYNYIWNKIYKRDKLMALNMLFPVGMVYEDIYWLVKIVFSLNGFATVPNTFYYYRKNSGSTVNQKNAKNRIDFLNSVKELYQFFKDHNIPIPPHRLGQKDRIKIFGKEIMKIEYYYPAKLKYKLFGFINLFEIERFDPDYYIKTNQ